MRDLFEKLYRRFGARYPYLLLFCAGSSIPLLAVAFGLVIGALYTDLSKFDYLRALALLFAWMALVGTVAQVTVMRTLYRPKLAWLNGRRGRDGAEQAWHAAVTDLPRAVLYAGTITAVGALPIEVYLATVAGLGDRAGIAGVVAASSGFCFLGSVIHYFLWERALRPVVADIARQLPVDFAPKASAVSIRGRLLVLVPAMNVLTGLVAAGASTDALGPGEKVALGIGVALAVSATAALTLTLLLQRSLTRPLEDLLGAMRRVREGDLGAHVPVVSGDELGVVTHHFNTMLEGLQERQQLATENEALHARIRAQLEEVRASRARIVTASDAERRRVERNIHDGAQQHLVGLALQLRLLEERAAGDPELRAGLERAGAELSTALGELRELARGLHPQVLSTGGLAGAINQLADRSPVPVMVSAVEERFPEALESTAYFVASEALANVAKYSQAGSAEVSVERRNAHLVLSVSDDGVGGADIGAGTGLAGLADRVAALDGRLEVQSPAGEGTQVRVELPLGEERDGDVKG